MRKFPFLSVVAMTTPASAITAPQTAPPVGAAPPVVDRDPPLTTVRTPEQAVADYVTVRDQVKALSQEKEALRDYIVTQLLHPKEGENVSRRIGAHTVMYQWRYGKGESTFHLPELIKFFTDERVRRSRHPVYAHRRSGSDSTIIGYGTTHAGRISGLRQASARVLTRAISG